MVFRSPNTHVDFPGMKGAKCWLARGRPEIDSNCERYRFTFSQRNYWASHNDSGDVTTAEQRRWTWIRGVCCFLSHFTVSRHATCVRMLTVISLLVADRLTER
jgi:hypothetical protein